MTELPDAGLDARFDALSALVLSAGAIALEGFRAVRSGPTALKGPQDFLTETDAAVERHLRDELARLFPEDAFVGEEEGASGDGAFAWVADPIDGTANFSRGHPHFCVSLALARGNQVEMGAIYAPVADEFWIARRGRGATRNGRPIRVAGTTDLAATTVELGWSPRVPNERYIAAATALLATGVNLRRCGSAALGLAYVSDGRQDAYAELHINAWDCLAGILLVEEAGGVVNDFLAGGNPILAVAPGVAQEVAEATGIPRGRAPATDRPAA